jgi:hypothetical protein
MSAALDGDIETSAAANAGASLSPSPTISVWHPSAASAVRRCALSAGHRLAVDQGAVDLGNAGDDLAIGADPLAGRHEDQSARHQRARHDPRGRSVAYKGVTAVRRRSP